MHDVEQMFSYRQVPWHKKYTGDASRVLDVMPQSWGEARAEAGLGWEAEWVPTFGKVASDEALRKLFGSVLLDASASTSAQLDQLVALYHATLEEDPSYGRIIRNDTGATLSYQMRDSYQLIPNAAFGEMIDAIMQAGISNGQQMVDLETGGCLAGGKQVWMLARINEPITIPGDKSLSFPYLAITSRHDGKASCCARRTSVRVVCANTFRSAEDEGDQTGYVFDFAHRGKEGSWRDKVGQAREALAFARADTARWLEYMTGLAGIKITPAQQELWLHKFIPAPPPELATDRAGKSAEQRRDAVRAILGSETISGQGGPGSVYWIAQAAVEYLDHVRQAQDWQTRTVRMLLRPDQVKAKAIEYALEVAAA